MLSVQSKMSAKKNEKVMEREKSPEKEKPPPKAKKVSKKVTTTDNLPKVTLSTSKLPRIPKLKKMDSFEACLTPPPTVTLQTSTKKAPTFKVDVMALVTPGSPARSNAPSTTSQGSSKPRSRATGTSVSSTPKKGPSKKQIDDEM
jgi:hypothetical protein